MSTSMPRQVLGVLVWLGSVAGAAWLANGDGGVADAPAQLVPQEFKVAAAETGRLAEVLVGIGDRVKAGQKLARLDTAVLEREIAMAEARLRQLSAEPGASTATMESDGYSSERSFQADVDEAAGLMEAARAEEARQEAEEKALREEIARQRRLVKEGLTRADRVEELEMRMRSLSDAAAAWPARRQALEERRRQAENRLREWRTQHKASTAPASRDLRLQPLRDRVAEQREALQVLRTRLAGANIVAPAEGEVVSLLARQGDVASSGVPFLVLHGTGPRVLVAYINERSRPATGARAIGRRRTPEREELELRVQRVAEAVVQLPPRFWVMPTVPQWGREVYLEVRGAQRMDAGEALDVKFVSGGEK